MRAGGSAHRKVFIVHNRTMKSVHNRTMKIDSAQIPSVHKVGVTIYENWWLGTEKSVHCPLIFLEKIYELKINACDVHR